MRRYDNNGIINRIVCVWHQSWIRGLGQSWEDPDPSGPHPVVTSVANSRQQNFLPAHPRSSATKSKSVN
jgi:hypothetical protein